MTGYCVACHTRSSGADYSNQSTKGSVPGLKPFEQAEYFTSTRQFDRALGDYERIVEEAGKTAEYSPDWERAARTSLALAIRVKNDPDRALRIVERVIATHGAPCFLKEQASAWKESLLKWKAEVPRSAQSEEGYYAEAIRLVSEAKALQKYPADRSADVLYLRASRTVHDQLRAFPDGKRLAEALYLAGLCYEVLDGLNLWDLHEVYYQACIQKAPHSVVARQCYRHYEESVYTGFSGSAGTSIPGDVKQKLNRLEFLSSPQGDFKNRNSL
jgi:hypothetical protein